MVPLDRMTSTGSVNSGNISRNFRTPIIGRFLFASGIVFPKARYIDPLAVPIVEPHVHPDVVGARPVQLAVVGADEDRALIKRKDEHGAERNRR